MRPAFSVILFTVSSGAGLGLMFWLALARLSHAGTASPQWWTGAFAAALLITAGLISSTLHLANRKNAWRALSQFRTSWLSREGVLAVLLYPLAAVFLWAVHAQVQPLVSLLGAVLALLALATLYSTAMIYACLKTIPRWHNWQTRLAYPLFGLMSGAVIMLAFVPQARPFAAPLALVFLVLGALLKLSYLLRFGEGKAHQHDINAALQPLRKQQAGQLRLLDVGHSAGTFLTHEFMFEVARERAQTVLTAMWLLAFVVPALIIALAPQWAALAGLSCLVGLLCERWMFFAQARHVVQLYHGRPGV